MKKNLLAVLGSAALAATAVGIGVAHLTRGEQKAVKAAPEGTTIQYSSFHLRAWVEGNNAYVNIALPEYDITTADETAAGIYNDVDVRLWANINFANYLYVNDKPILGWEQLNEDGVRRNGYTVINMADTSPSIRFTLGVPSGYSITSVEVKKGFQLPSYAYLTESAENPWILYEAETDYKAVPSDAPWGWTTSAYANPDSLRYVQGHDGTAGYVGISFPGDDFAGSLLEGNTNNNWRSNYPSKVYANGHDDVLPFRQYGLFSLGGDFGQGHYAMQCVWSAAQLNKVTIPAGTTFPARISTVLAPLNNNNYPVVQYVTTEERSFQRVTVGGDDSKFYASNEVLDEFVQTKLKFDTVPTTDEGTGKCISEGWYEAAKAAFLELGDPEKALLSAVEYADAYARLQDWAAANGEVFNGTSFTSASGINGSAFRINETVGAYAYIVPIVCLAAVALVVTFVVKKRKRHN